MIDVNIPADYFYCSYRDPSTEREFKRKVNEDIQRALKNEKITNIPNKQKVAVISSSWVDNHVVWRNCYSLISALKKKYHLTLFHFGPDVPDISLFDEFRIIKNWSINSLSFNDFAVVFYPDVGMRIETIMLSNLRIAPIQITCVGHPVSTFGSKIDYYISGEDTEKEDAQKWYSEKLIRLPGIGFGNKTIKYVKKGLTKSEFTINCTANKKKWNNKFINTLGKIFKAVKRPITFQIFPGMKGPLSWIPDLETLSNALKPAKLVIQSVSTYDAYMEQQEGAALNLDSFFFAGCNTVCDSLYLGIPMLYMEGDRMYNRNGSVLLRAAKVPELICHNEEEYIDKAIRLIEDDDYRNNVASKIDLNFINDEPDLGFLEFINRKTGELA